MCKCVVSFFFFYCLLFLLPFCWPFLLLLLLLSWSVCACVDCRFIHTRTKMEKRLRTAHSTHCINKWCRPAESDRCIKLIIGFYRALDVYSFEIASFCILFFCFFHFAPFSCAGRLLVDGYYIYYYYDLYLFTMLLVISFNNWCFCYFIIFFFCLNLYMRCFRALNTYTYIYCILSIHKCILSQSFIGVQ